MLVHVGLKETKVIKAILANRVQLAQQVHKDQKVTQEVSVLKALRGIKVIRVTKEILEKLVLRAYKVFLDKLVHKVCRDQREIKEILLHILTLHKHS
jgi:hypothetical protein